MAESMGRTEAKTGEFPVYQDAASYEKRRLKRLLLGAQPTRLPVYENASCLSRYYQIYQATTRG